MVSTREVHETREVEEKVNNRGGKSMIDKEGICQFKSFMMVLSVDYNFLVDYLLLLRTVLLLKRCKMHGLHDSGKEWSIFFFFLMEVQ